MQEDVFQRKEKAVVGLLASTSLFLREVQSGDLETCESRIQEREQFLVVIEDCDRVIGKRSGPNDEKMFGTLEQIERMTAEIMTLIQEQTEYAKKETKFLADSRAKMVDRNCLPLKGTQFEARG